MARAGKLEIQITGDTKDLERALSRASKKTEDFGGTLSKVGKVGALAAGAAGIGALTASLKIGIDEYANAAKIAAQTNATLKSTGEVANVSAKQVDGMASSLLKKSGIDDEAIKSGENMLLTFTNIRNETGKNNDMFNQATKVVTDMTVAMNHGHVTQENMAKSAILVGKALNDPVKGMSALQRVGVSFDGQQKQTVKDLIDGRKAVDNFAQVYTGKLSPAQQEQIVKMSKAHAGWKEIADTMHLKVAPAQAKMMDYWEQGGHQMEAQQMITKELNKEFGGSAEALGKTLPGQINIAKETFRNWMGDLVTKAIPVLERVIGWLKDHWPEIQKALQSFWDSAKPILENLMDLLAAAWPIAKKAIQLFLPVLKDVAQVVAGVVKLVSALLSGDWAKAWDAAKNIVMGVVNTIRDYLKAAVTIWWGAISGVFQTVFVTPFQTAFNAVWTWIKDHWVNILVVAIGGLPALAWTLLQKQIETNLVTPFKTAMTNIGTWVKEEITRWAGYIAALPGKIADFGKTLLTTITGFFTSSGVAKFVTERVADWAEFITGLPGKIKDFGAALLSTITGFVTNSGIAKFLTDKVADFAGFFKSLPGKIGDALVSGAKGAANQLKGWFSDLFGWLPDWAKTILQIHSPSKVFEDIGEHIIGGLIKGLGNMAGKLKDYIEAHVGAPIDWAAKKIAAIGGMVGDLVTGGATGVANGTLQLPAYPPLPHHDTLGLPGYPAHDMMAPGGTVALSPAAGKIVKESGRPFSEGWSSGPGSAIGLSMYLLSKAGEYFLTHFSSLYAGVGATVGQGQPIGVVGPMDDYGVSAHIHEGFHAFAKGGIVRGGRGGVLGLIGEGRHDEAVIPLGRGMGGPAVIVNVGTLAGSSAAELADVIYRELVRGKLGNCMGNLGLT